jgi:predicted O-methyltransferase YrrM
VVDLTTAAKGGYVGAMRLGRRAATALGLLDGPPPPRERRARHWVRSLFAIHDVDALIALDMPWWTYAAADAVEGFLRSRPDARVFEFGSGASTVWLARRAAEVTSVEHDAEWFALLAPRLRDVGNVDYRLVEPDPVDAPEHGYRSMKSGYRGRTFGAYARSIADGEGPFDLVVVDGRARAACLREARRHLRPDGLIVFDNAHRRRYREAIRASALEETAYRGMVPSLPLPDTTSLLHPRR